MNTPTMHSMPGTPEYEAEKDERIDWVLSKLDVENIEDLTLAELTNVFIGKYPARLEDVSQDVSPIRKEWFDLDTDGNEAIEPHEFFEPVEDALKQLDFNNDGMISADEIE